MKTTKRKTHVRTNPTTGQASMVKEHQMRTREGQPKSNSSPPPPPPVLAEDGELEPVTEKPVYLSPSAASTWNQCPRRWYHKYVDKLPEPPPGEPAVLGNFVHTVLEELTKQPPSERTRETAREIAREHFREFQDTQNWKDLNYGEEEAKKFRKKAWATVETYFSNVDVERVQPIGQEIQVDIDLDGVPFMGFVDLVERDPDTGDVIITDYKTGKPPSNGMPWSGDERGEKLLQPLWYAAALQEMGEYTPKHARLMYFTVKERPDGTYEQIADELGVDVTPESLKAAKAELSRRWEDIQQARATGETEARPGPLCGWCPHVQRCDEGQKEVVARWNKTNPRTGERRLRADAPAVKVLNLDDSNTT